MHMIFNVYKKKLNLDKIPKLKFPNRLLKDYIEASGQWWFIVWMRSNVPNDMAYFYGSFKNLGNGRCLLNKDLLIKLYSYCEDIIDRAYDIYDAEIKYYLCEYHIVNKEDCNVENIIKKINKSKDFIKKCIDNYNNDYTYVFEFNQSYY